MLGRPHRDLVGWERMLAERQRPLAAVAAEADKLAARTRRLQPHIELLAVEWGPSSMHPVRSMDS